MVIARSIPIVLVAGSLACAPHLDDRLFLVDAPRVIAVRAEPAEAPPGTPITYHALEVGPDGELTDALDWAFCTERAPLASLGSVSPHCLAADGDVIVPFGSPSVDAVGTVPADACRVFGPEVPAMGQPGDPPGRPVDPDPSGGYYQPVRVLSDASESGVTIERTRIFCGLASGTGDDRVDYMHRYHANTNPALASIDLALADGSHVVIDTSMPLAPIPIAAATRIVLHASWAVCESTVDTLPMTGCAGAEPFLVYDSAHEQIVEHRETMRLAWFATGGALAFDQTGRDASDTEVSSDDTWTTPSEAGPASIWIVVRDDRGGVGWFRIDFLVTT